MAYTEESMWSATLEIWFDFRLVCEWPGLAYHYQDVLKSCPDLFPGDLDFHAVSKRDEGAYVFKIDLEKDCGGQMLELACTAWNMLIDANLPFNRTVGEWTRSERYILREDSEATVGE